MVIGKSRRHAAMIDDSDSMVFAGRSKLELELRGEDQKVHMHTRLSMRCFGEVYSLELV